MEQKVHFIKPSPVGVDKYYKMYKLNGEFAFIKLGGQFFAEGSIDNTLPIFGDIVFSLLFGKEWKKIRLKKEEKLDQQMQLDKTAVLQRKHSFTIPFNRIEQIKIRYRSSFHTAWNDNGKVVVTLTTGEVYKFLVPLTIPIESVIHMFEEESLLIEYQDKKRAY
ncbi:hypothetical protein [Priestia koreensis]|uniref:Uncharacterized protein n=1 Tax=Priestia koreensis TaxID=284581 RepID=A0A0M0LBY2_9BACI|nr:hypothetical protein [Priestia koreensis]KOO48575.1 hypothetical protein AMD01_04100 [Priestia koreensis]MCM3005651.1 hypothetical protein [Priestia koreensis]